MGPLEGGRRDQGGVRKVTHKFDAAARRVVLKDHNDARRTINARLADPSRHLPDLQWNDTLAEQAAEYTAQCKFAHPENNPRGESIYLGWAPFFTTSEHEAEKAIAAWHEEIDNVDWGWECITNTPKTPCGHYSQVVWKNTT